jgi:hypothetical protein
MTKRLFENPSLFQEFMDKPFNRDEQSLDFYLERFKALVKSIANQYLDLAEKAAYSFEDLTQIGYETLQRAYWRFDPDRKRRNRASGSIGHFFSYVRQSIVRSIQREVFAAVGLPSSYRAQRTPDLKPVSQLSLERLDDDGVIPAQLVDSTSLEETIIKLETNKEQLSLILENLYILDSAERFVVESMMNGIPLEEIEGNFQDGQAETAKAVFRRAVTKLKRAIRRRQDNAYRQ